jgi:hypothetical protein
MSRRLHAPRAIVLSDGAFTLTNSRDGTSRSYPSR